MPREDTLRRYPPLLAVHRALTDHLPVEYALMDLAAQMARAELVARRRPWRGVPRNLPVVGGPQRETLFVLGTGASINLLPQEAWSEIGAAASLGINFWLLHRFVPSAYVTEWGSERDPFIRRILDIRREILRLRAPDIAHTPFYFRTPAVRRVRHAPVTPADVSRQLPLPEHQVTVTADLNLPPLSGDDFLRTLQLWARAGMLRARPTWRYLPTARGTVLWALLYAARMGFRHVVLCGVDLGTTRYFYEDPDSPWLVSGLPVPTSMQTGTVHRTNDPAQPGPTIQEIVVGLRDRIFPSIGLTMSVGHSSSVLAEELPLYPWEFSKEPAVGQRPSAEV